MHDKYHYKKKNQQFQNTRLGLPPMVKECRRTTGTPGPTFIARTPDETPFTESAASARAIPSATLFMWPMTDDAFPVEAARSERVGDTESSPRASMRSACGKTLEICAVSRRVGCASDRDRCAEASGRTGHRRRERERWKTRFQVKSGR